MKMIPRFFYKLIFAVAIVAYANVSLADIPGLEVNGNTISWTTTGYMQVQNSTDFQTVCEGNQLSCTVPAGIYIVIDHTASIRQEGVLVEETNQPITRPYTLVTNRRVNQSAFPLNKYTLRAECPGGMLPIGGGCEGLLVDGSAFSSSNFMPGSGHIAPVLRAYVCNFMDTDFNADREVQLMAQATCVFDNDVRRLTTDQ